MMWRMWNAVLLQTGAAHEGLRKDGTEEKYLGENIYE